MVRLANVLAVLVIGVFEPGKRFGIQLVDGLLDLMLNIVHVGFLRGDPRPSLGFKASQHLARVPQPPAPDLRVPLAT
jgi:hypothetical protein